MIWQTHILEIWRGYTDEEAFIYAETDGEPHNTITPIARKVGDIYELDLTLRNNITTEEHPLGVYHPHARISSYQERKYRSDRGYGTCSSSGQIKRQRWNFWKSIFSKAKILSSNEQIEETCSSGLRSFFRNIRKSQKKTSMAFFRKRLESYLPMFWKMQEYTNVRPREEKHSCVFLKHYKN